MAAGLLKGIWISMSGMILIITGGVICTAGVILFIANLIYGSTGAKKIKKELEMDYGK